MAHEIRLYGPIGGMFGLTPEGILGQIPAGTTDIVMRIHSPGGSVGDGIAMYKALKDNPARIVAIVDGYAASTASFVMLAADEVHVHESSLVFLHKPWSVSEGNADDMRKSAEDLDKHEDAIIAIYSRKTGKSAEEMKAILREEMFLSGAEAVEMGLADVLVDDPEAEIEVAALIKNDAKLQERIQMSTQKTRREITAELEAAQARIDTISAEAELKINAALSKAGEIEAMLTTRSAEVETLSATVAQLTEVNAGHAAVMAEAQARAEVLAKTIGEHEATIKSMTMRLADPAYVDASLTAVNAKLIQAVDAEADAAEAAAKTSANGRLVLESYWDHYDQLPEAEKHKFYMDYKNELTAEKRG